MTIEDASVLMDAVRSEPGYRYTAPWHCVDFPKGTTYQQTDDPNAVNALTTAINALQSSSTLPVDSVRFYLLVVMHVIGDIHQPLHTRYAEDKGGNDYPISILGC